jgi:Uma2 family endonuclease
MPLLKNNQYTSEDYWNLPEGTRAELIDGKLYDMAPPSRIHQQLVMELAGTIREYIKKNHAKYTPPHSLSTLTPMIKTG